MKKPDRMSLPEFRRRFKELRKRGFVRSVRRGPTGVGHTLEHELGLVENNIAFPDIGRAEIKAHRGSSSSLVTLFTFNRKVWKVKPLDAVRNYGSKDANGRLGLYFTMTMTPNSLGLFVRLEQESIDLRHIDGTLIASWKLADLAEQFKRKIPALIYVTADVEERNHVEYFYYMRAQSLVGLSWEGLRSAIREGAVCFDIGWKTKELLRQADEFGVRIQGAELPSVFARVTDL